MQENQGLAAGGGVSSPTVGYTRVAQGAVVHKLMRHEAEPGGRRVRQKTKEREMTMRFGG